MLAYFPEDVEESDKIENADDGDYLRASYWREQEEQECKVREVLGITKDESGKDVSAVKICTEVPENAMPDDVFAVPGEQTVKYWVCKADWAVSNFVEGLESPANYTSAFAPAEDIEGFDKEPIYYSLKQYSQGKSTVKKGAKLAIAEQYWEYYTCIKPFNKAEIEEIVEEPIEGAFSEHPAYFIPGLPVGDAVPCKGKWSFYSSGVWFGAFEVRRNFDKQGLGSNWESRGMSFSRNDAASNTAISGTESDEECWLRLFITKSRKLSDATDASALISGFPPDGCSIRLIVERYKHDIVLQLHKPGWVYIERPKEIQTLCNYDTSFFKPIPFARIRLKGPDGTIENHDIENFTLEKLKDSIKKNSKYFDIEFDIGSQFNLVTKLKGSKANTADIILPAVDRNGNEVRAFFLDSTSIGFPLISTNEILPGGYVKESREASFTREGKVLPELPLRIATADWSWSAYSNRNGYPLLCSVFQQRLVFASTRQSPLTVWFSRVDDIDNFLRGDVDDAAITLTLSAPSQNPICWMQPQDDRLMLGTSAMEYSIISSSQNLVFSSTSARARAHSYVGSDGTPAIAAINKAVFVERGSTRVYEYGWNEESGGYIPRELSVFAPHIGGEHGGFVYPTVMTKPDVVLVWTLGDGQLALCTYNNLQEVRAWHRWTTDGRILSACAMPNGREEDSLYLVVERNEGDSEAVYNIEVIDKNSPYIDEGGRDYESIIITNPLFFAVQEMVRKRNDNTFWFRFGCKYDYVFGGLEVSTDGGSVWRSPDWNEGSFNGWVEAKSDATWQFEKRAGIRVRGNRGCHILGLQG
jgi:hypothetical protein